MKEKLTRNIGLKILSIILAALLWLLITNVDDPISTKDFRDVPVEVLNAEEIKALGQVYDIVEGETIDFTITARRTIRDDLTVSDFRVTADLSKLSDVNAVTIKITCPRYGDQVTIMNNNQVMKVNLEESADKHFKVNVEQKGEPAEGYYVYEKTASTIIRVSGPKSKIDSIAQIVAEVDVTSFAGSFRTIESLKALDSEENEIDDSNLSFSDKTVSINIGMYKTQEIALKVNTTGAPADGYVISNVEYEPKTIEVAADNDVLNGIQDLTISEHIDNASSTIEKEINLQEQLEDGVILVGDNQTVTVNITIEKAETKEVSIQQGDIEVRNMPSTFRLEYLTAAPILVRVTGPAKELENISKDTLKPYIDLSAYSAGTYYVEIKADITGYATIANSPTVHVNLVQ